MIQYLFLALFGGLLAAVVYSWYFGTTILGASVSGALGAGTGYITDIYVGYSDALAMGYNNFFESGYLGFSMLLVGFVLFISVMAMNLITTLDTEPTAIQ